MQSRFTWAVVLSAAAVLLIAAGCDRSPCPTGSPAGGAPPVVSAEPRYRSRTSPYEPGLLDVQVRAMARCERGAPVPLRVYAPRSAGVYAVVQFQHGFILDNRHYSELLSHLAGHGFVVIAPQMYPADGLPLGKPTSVEEAARVVRVLEWLPGGLELAPGVTPDFGAIGLVGHSRGGKAVWRLLTQEPDRAQAVVGIEPVDGTGGPLGGEDRITDRPFAFAGPSLIIGAGRGGSCSPEGDNHVQFYASAGSPTWHVFLPEAGHTDVLDADRSGCGVACTVCRPGLQPDAARRLIIGLVTDFLVQSLQDLPVSPADLVIPVELADLAQISRK